MAKKINKEFETLQLWLEDGIDIEKRRIFFEEDVADYSVGNVIRALMTMSEKDSKAPIDIYISSYGGVCYDGLALYDIITSLECEVRTHAIGKQMSMGLIIFLAGDVRTCSENSTLMAHSVASGTADKLYQMETDTTETKRLNELLISILANKSNKNAAWWRKQTKFEDNYYSKADAIKLGLVTEE